MRRACLSVSGARRACERRAAAAGWQVPRLSDHALQAGVRHCHPADVAQVPIATMSPLSPLKLIVACLAAASAAKKGPKVTNKVVALLALRRRSMHSHATGASLTGLL